MAAAGILKVQPFKGLYVTISLLDLLIVRIPWWTLRNLIRAWRPRPSWALRRCLLVNFTRYLYVLAGRVGGVFHNPTYKEMEGGEGVKGVWIDAVPELVTGQLNHWANVTGVEGARIPGYWYHKSNEGIKTGEPAKEGEKVVLSFHGGAYIGLSAHPSSPVSLVPRGILKHAPVTLRRALNVEYRLASPGCNPFPAQLLDALAAYAYLIRELGFKPENIIVVGDSAGGNLALALTRYLITHADSLDARLGKPGGLVLLSPWCDLTNSHHSPGGSVYRHARSDFLLPPPQSDKQLGYAVSLLAGPHGHDFIRNEYVSPACKSNSPTFTGFPPSIIVLGGAEALEDSIRTLNERMVHDMGDENVKMHVASDGFHDFIAFGFGEPERTEACIAIGTWIDSL